MQPTPFFGEDDWTREERIHRARWVLTFSDGRFIVQDDGRPGIDPLSAWQRLLLWWHQAPCQHPQGFRPVKLHVEFRGERLAPLPENADGYFFRRAVLGELNGPSYDLYVLGYLEGDRVKVQRYFVPEFTKLNEEVLSVESCRESLLVCNLIP